MLSKNKNSCEIEIKPSLSKPREKEIKLRKSLIISKAIKGTYFISNSTNYRSIEIRYGTIRSNTEIKIDICLIVYFIISIHSKTINTCCKRTKNWQN